MSIFPCTDLANPGPKTPPFHSHILAAPLFVLPWRAGVGLAAIGVLMVNRPQLFGR